MATLEKVALRLENEQRMSSKFLITVCVRYGLVDFDIFKNCQIDIDNNIFKKC